MSYILEALKKSQQERELGVVPSLQAVSFDDRAASESPHRWVYVALLLAGVAVAIALFAVLRADPFGSGSAMVASTTEVDSLPGVPSTRVSPHAVVERRGQHGDRANGPRDRGRPCWSARDPTPPTRAADRTDFRVSGAISGTGRGARCSCSQATLSGPSGASRPRGAATSGAREY